MHLKEVFHKLSKSLDVHVVLGIPLDSKDNRSQYGGSAPSLIGKSQNVAL